MPRLLRGIARTAVVAGTATAVSNRVSRRQAGRWAAQGEPQAAEPADEQAPVAEGDPITSQLDQLKQLGELKAQGVLTEDEFQEQKRRILG
jgi:hypothetical protein